MPRPYAKSVSFAGRGFRAASSGVRLAAKRSAAFSARRVFYRRNRVSVALRAAPELKYNDLVSATYVSDTTGTVTALNLIAVGDDNTNRDGRQVTNKSVHIQGLLQPTDNTTVPNLARLIIVWDSQPNGALPAVTALLTNSNSISATNLDNRERFTILRDVKFPQGMISDTATQAFSNGGNTHAVNLFIPLKDMKTTYSGTTAVIGSVATGALLMFTIGNAAAGNGGIFSLTTRLRFSDY